MLAKWLMLVGNLPDAAVNWMIIISSIAAQLHNANKYSYVAVIISSITTSVY